MINIFGKVYRLLRRPKQQDKGAEEQPKDGTDVPTSGAECKAPVGPDKGQNDGATGQGACKPMAELAGVVSHKDGGTDKKKQKGSKTNKTDAGNTDPADTETGNSKVSSNKDEANEDGFKLTGACKKGDQFDLNKVEINQSNLLKDAEIKPKNKNQEEIMIDRVHVNGSPLDNEKLTHPDVEKVKTNLENIQTDPSSDQTVHAEKEQNKSMVGECLIQDTSNDKSPLNDMEVAGANIPSGSTTNIGKTEKKQPQLVKEEGDQPQGGEMGNQPQEAGEVGDQSQQTEKENQSQQQQLIGIGNEAQAAGEVGDQSHQQTVEKVNQSQQQQLIGIGNEAQAAGQVGDQSQHQAEEKENQSQQQQQQLREKGNEAQAAGEVGDQSQQLGEKENQLQQPAGEVEYQSQAGENGNRETGEETNTEVSVNNEAAQPLDGARQELEDNVTQQSNVAQPARKVCHYYSRGLRCWKGKKCPNEHVKSADKEERGREPQKVISREPQKVISREPQKVISREPQKVISVSDFSNYADYVDAMTSHNRMVVAKDLLYNLGYQKHSSEDSMGKVLVGQHKVAVYRNNWQWVQQARYYAAMFFPDSWIDENLPHKDIRSNRKKQKKPRKTKEGREWSEPAGGMCKDIRLKEDPNMPVLTINAADTDLVESTSEETVPSVSSGESLPDPVEPVEKEPSVATAESLSDAVEPTTVEKVPSITATESLSDAVELTSLEKLQSVLAAESQSDAVEPTTIVKERSVTAAVDHVEPTTLDMEPLIAAAVESFTLEKLPSVPSDGSLSDALEPTTIAKEPPIATAESLSDVIKLTSLEKLQSVLAAESLSNGVEQTTLDKEPLIAAAESLSNGVEPTTLEKEPPISVAEPLSDVVEPTLTEEEQSVTEVVELVEPTIEKEQSVAAAEIPPDSVRATTIANEQSITAAITDPVEPTSIEELSVEAPLPQSDHSAPTSALQESNTASKDISDSDTACVSDGSMSELVVENKASTASGYTTALDESSSVCVNISCAKFSIPSLASETLSKDVSGSENAFGDNSSTINGHIIPVSLASANQFSKDNSECETSPEMNASESGIETQPVTTIDQMAVPDSLDESSPVCLTLSDVSLTASQPPEAVPEDISVDNADSISDNLGNRPSDMNNRTFVPDSLEECSSVSGTHSELVVENKASTASGYTTALDYRPNGSSSDCITLSSANLSTSAPLKGTISKDIPDFESTQILSDVGLSASIPPTETVPKDFLEYNSALALDESKSSLENQSTHPTVDQTVVSDSLDECSAVGTTAVKTVCSKSSVYSSPHIESVDVDAKSVGALSQLESFTPSMMEHTNQSSSACSLSHVPSITIQSENMAVIESDTPCDAVDSTLPNAAEVAHGNLSGRFVNACARNQDGTFDTELEKCPNAKIDSNDDLVMQPCAEGERLNSGNDDEFPATDVEGKDSHDQLVEVSTTNANSDDLAMAEANDNAGENVISGDSPAHISLSQNDLTDSCLEGKDCTNLTELGGLDSGNTLLDKLNSVSAPLDVPDIVELLTETSNADPSTEDISETSPVTNTQ